MEKLKQLLVNVCAIMRFLLRFVPLASGLAFATWETIREAVKEFLFIWFISLLPIIFCVIFEVAGTIDHPFGLWGIAHSFYLNMHSGEVFIYATTLLAPVGFVIYQYNRKNRRFPSHLSFMGSLIITIAFSAYLFGLQRSGGVKNQTFIDWSGFIAYVFALALWFLSLVYNHILFDYDREQHRQEDDLSRKLNSFEVH